MDISNLTQNLIKGLEQKNNAELTALSRVLDIALGKVTIAQVTETIPVTPQERQALLNKTAESLTKLASSPQLTPAAKEEMSRLLEQQTLIKSPDLKWVNLLVNNRQQLTYSNKPLAAGQTVAVRLVTPEKLVLLDLPEAKGDHSPATSTTKDPARAAGSPTYTAQSLATQSHLANSIPAAQKTIANETSQLTSEHTSDEQTSAANQQENSKSATAVKNTASDSPVSSAKVQMAVVTETAPITADERQELLKKTTEELVQLGKIAPSTPGVATPGVATPGLKEAITSLLQQQALIKSPDTKWIHLQVENQSLLTYSDKPLLTGQPVPVQVVTPQKILLLDLPETDTPETGSLETSSPETSSPETKNIATDNAQTVANKLKLLSATINLALATGKNLVPTYFAKLAAEQDAKPTAAAPDKSVNSIATPTTTTPASAAAPAKIFIARITETAPLLPEERSELLKKTSEELAQLSKMASASAQPVPGVTRRDVATPDVATPDVATPGLKEAINALLHQQALIKTPGAKWIHLQVGNQTLLTYSDKPLVKGQSVPVQLVTPQKILLLDQSESPTSDAVPLNQNSLAPPQKSSTPTYFAKLAAVEPQNITGESPSEAPEEKVANNIAVKNTTTTPAPPVKVQMATITETAPLRPEERQELLKKTGEELLQLNKMPRATPGVQDAIASLSQQQALIKSPEAKWIHLQVNNQSLLTYSDKPLATGQTIPVQIITPHKIQLLDLPNVKGPDSAAKISIESLPSTLVAQKKSTPAFFAQLAPPESIKPQAMVQNETVSAATITTIENATVIKATPVSPQQRQELMQKITENLQQINKLANISTTSIPSVKEIISSLLEQQALLKSPDLKWLELSVNNRPITTYTDKSLSPGQTIRLQQSAAQHLALLDSEALETSDDVATTVKNIQQPEKIAKTDLPKTQLPETLALDIETEEDISSPAISSAANPWQHIPSLTRQILTPKTLEQALKSVAEQIRWKLQLNQPASLVTVAKLSSAAPATTMANDKKITGNFAAKTEITSAQSQQLEEIDQVLSGSSKKLSIELTAKLLQELVKIQVRQAANTQASNQASNQVTNKAAAADQTASGNTPQTADLSRDIERGIQQLLHRPGSEATNKEARAQLLQLMQHDPETLKEMDIGKLTQYLSKSLEQKNNAELSTLSRALNITLGKAVMADVAETAPVTPQERKDLLAKTGEALAQLNKLPPSQWTPATKVAISQLLEQQALIQSPNLRWATLMVNNRPLLTYTDKPLSPGQAVPVQLLDSQKLVLLTLPESNSAEKNPAGNLAGAATGNNANPTYLAKLAGSAGLTDLTKNTASTNVVNPGAASSSPLGISPLSPNALNPNALGVGLTNPGKIQSAAAANNLGKATGDFTAYKQDTQQLKQVVAENLRRLLPYKDIPSALLGALRQWQTLPAASQQRLTPVTVEQALKNLAEQIRSPLHIIQPKVLAQIIKNSGVFFESALNNSLADAAAESTPPTTAEGSKTMNPNSNASVAHIFNQDLKGSLLTLLSKVNQELTGSSKPLTDEQTVKLLQQLSSNSSAAGTASTYTPATAATFTKDNPSVDIGLLMQQIMSKPVKELSDKELRTQLLVLLQQHSVHSLAKIQLQQLASLNSEVSSKDPSQPTASWQIEIPLRHHNDVQQLQLQIDREWVEEKNPSPENTSVAKVKQWSVTLRFDLPTLGEFCAQLAIIDTSVSATLWASEEKTFGQVRKQMEDLRKNLEREGINVKQLQCMKGMPAQKPMALSYSLIDIST